MAAPVLVGPNTELAAYVTEAAALWARYRLSGTVTMAECQGRMMDSFGCQASDVTAIFAALDSELL